MEARYSLSDLPEELQEIAEVIGMEATRALIDFFGGQTVYFPAPHALERTARNREIRAAFTGDRRDTCAIARKYHLSTRQIFRICEQKKHP